MAYKAGDVMVSTSEEFQARDPQFYAVLAEVYRRDHRIPADVYWLHPARLNSAPADLKNDCYS